MDLRYFDPDGDEEGNATAKDEVKINVVYSNPGGEYKVMPSEVVDQECADEDGMRGDLDDDEEAYDITDESHDEPGAEGVNVSDITKLMGEQLKTWTDSMREELNSLNILGVYDPLTKAEVFEKYWGKKISTRIFPAKLVATKTEVRW